MLQITLLEKHIEIIHALNPTQVKALILSLLSGDGPDIDEITSLARTSILSDNNEIKLNLAYLNQKKSIISGKRRIAGSLGGKKKQENRLKKQELSTKTSKIKQNEKSYPPKLAKPSKTSICFPPNNPLYSSQVININNIFNTHLGVCKRVSTKSENERKLFFYLHGDPPPDFIEKEREAYFEIIDTLIEAIYQSRSEKGLLFRRKQYFLKDMIELILKIDFEHPRIQNLMQCLNHKSEMNIQNSPFYIFGALVNAVEVIDNQIKEYFGGEDSGKCKI